MIRKAAYLILALVAGGCGGQYILTKPDQLAPAGKQAAVVVRLQRNDFFVLSLPVKDVAISFTVEGMPERGAYTDEIGYAGTFVPAPESPGRYKIDILHQDVYGDAVTGQARLYVFPSEARVVAVDVEALPSSQSAQGPRAAEALARLVTKGCAIIYLTSKEADQTNGLHDALSVQGYPDGPILLWQNKNWHIVQGSWRIPKIVIEEEMVSRLPEIRKQFANFTHGVTSSSAAAKAFTQAGLTPVIVGDAQVEAANAIRRPDWQQLGDMPLGD